MYEKLTDRAQGELLSPSIPGLGSCTNHVVVLDETIDDMADLVKSHYGIQDLGDPAEMTEVRVVPQHLGLIAVS